jgi:hypothetical protein
MGYMHVISSVWSSLSECCRQVPGTRTFPMSSKFKITMTSGVYAQPCFISHLQIASWPTCLIELALRSHLLPYKVMARSVWERICVQGCLSCEVTGSICALSHHVKARSGTQNNLPTTWKLYIVVSRGSYTVAAHMISGVDLGLGKHPGNQRRPLSASNPARLYVAYKV